MQATERRERAVRFVDWEVRGLLDGSKTQFRRVVKPQAASKSAEIYARPDGQFIWTLCAGVGVSEPLRCPYGKPGDLLWVRETWAKVFQDDFQHEKDSPFVIEYRADTGNPYPGYWPEECKDDQDCGRWKPSIHMPRWASRLTLEVTGERVERVQDISEGDVLKEGLELHSHVGADGPDCPCAFIGLWNTQNAKRGYSWESNPWVWVTETKLVEAKA